MAEDKLKIDEEWFSNTFGKVYEVQDLEEARDLIDEKIAELEDNDDD